MNEQLEEIRDILEANGAKVVGDDDMLEITAHNCVISLILLGSGRAQFGIYKEKKPSGRIAEVCNYCDVETSHLNRVESEHIVRFISMYAKHRRLFINNSTQPMPIKQAIALISNEIKKQK